jgi:hypothetical protein
VTEGVARKAALGGIVGPVAYWVAILVGAPLEADRLGDLAARPGLRPGYSHVYSFVSELAAKGSDAELLMWAGFYLLGAGTVLLALAMRRLWPAATALFVAVLVSGLGTLMAGSFRCDPGCPTKGDLSTSQELHNLSSVLTFPAWMACAAIAAWTFRDRLFGRLSLAVLVVQVGTGLVLGSWASDRGADDPVGIWQRINLAAVAVWFAVAAVEVRRTPQGVGRNRS